MCIDGNIVDNVYKDGMKTRKFVMPIYHQRITFAIGKDMKKMNKKLGIHTPDTNYSSYSAMTVRAKESDRQYRYYLLVKKYKSSIYLSDIIHEIAHFCTVICEDVGVKTESWNDEPFAYMCEYTFRQFLDFTGAKDKIKI